MTKPKLEVTVIDLITELRLVQGDLVRLGHPKGAMVVAQAVGSLAQYKAEAEATKKAADEILAPMTMEVGRLMFEAPDEEITLIAYGDTIKIPASKFNALYRATDYA